MMVIQIVIFIILMMVALLLIYLVISEKNYIALIPAVIIGYFAFSFLFPILWIPINNFLFQEI